VFQADRVGGGVQVVAVSKSHLVSTSHWVHVWAVLFIREIAAIVVSVTFVFRGNTSSHGTLELVSGTGTLDLIGSVSAVVITVAQVVQGDAF
jgi:hypothetical protein